MNTLESLNRWASKLSVEEINHLTEEEILDKAVERPEYPGSYGFMLSPETFLSTEHFSITIYALMKRLGEVQNLKEKMKHKTSKFSK